MAFTIYFLIKIVCSILMEYTYLGFNESLAQMRRHKILHCVGYFVGTQTSQNQNALEIIQVRLPFPW